VNTQAQLLPVPSVLYRIEVFLARIQPLYPLVKGKGPQRPAALKRLQRLCEREVNLLRSEHTLANVKLYLSSYRSARRAIDPNTRPCAPANTAPISASATWLTPEETRAIKRRLPDPDPQGSIRSLPLGCQRIYRNSQRALRACLKSRMRDMLSSV
jgi:hypothetical protein